MTEQPSPVHPSPQTTATSLPDWTTELRYASLRTFRADGTGVDAPIWFAVDGGVVLVRTPTASAKVRRLRTDPRAELRPCDWRGRPVDGPAVVASGEVLERTAAVAAEPILRRRYGWQWNVVPMISVPGVKSAHRGTPLRERFRLARATELWDASSILRLTPEG